MANPDGSLGVDPGGVPDPPRAAVRLLHPGHGDDARRRCSTRTPSPSEAEIREYLDGNICRCTGYHNIVKAIQAAAGRARLRRASRPSREAERWHMRRAASARASKRREDVRFLTGKGRYTDDLNRPGQALCRTSCARTWRTAASARLDTAAAAAMPGVLKVFTAKDFAARRRHPLRLAGHRPLRPADEGAEAPGARRGQGPPRRRPGRRGGRRDAGAGARRRRGDRARHRGAAGRRRHARGARRRARRRCTTTLGAQPLLRLGLHRGQPRRGRRGDRGRAARHDARARQQPAGAERRWSRAPRSASTTRPTTSTRSTPPARTRTSSGC